MPDPPLLRDAEPALAARAFPSMEEATRAVLNELAARSAFEQWVVSQTDTTADRYTIIDVVGERPMPFRAGDVFAYGDTLCRLLIDGADPVALDLGTHPVYSGTAARLESPARAYVGVPIEAPDGGVWGTLCGFASVPLSSAEADVHPFVLLCARLLATALDRSAHAADADVRAQESLEAAERDALTGLANRRHWDARLADGDDRRALGALLIDVDGLKVVNDRDGHAAGDALLRTTGVALAAALRPEDEAARLGGDEFGVLLEGCDVAATELVAERVRVHLAEAGVQASVGAAARVDGEPTTEVVRAADRAMYAQKRERGVRR